MAAKLHVLCKSARTAGRVPSEALAEQGFAADCLQPPLVPRFGFRQRLKPSVSLFTKPQPGHMLF